MKNKRQSSSREHSMGKKTAEREIQQPNKKSGKYDDSDRNISQESSSFDVFTDEERGLILSTFDKFVSRKSRWQSGWEKLMSESPRIEGSFNLSSSSLPKGRLFSQFVKFEPFAVLFVHANIDFFLTENRLEKFIEQHSLTGDIVTTFFRKLLEIKDSDDFKMSSPFQNSKSESKQSNKKSLSKHEDKEKFSGSPNKQSKERGSNSNNKSPSIRNNSMLKRRSKNQKDLASSQSIRNETSITSKKTTKDRKSSQNLELQYSITKIEDDIHTDKQNSQSGNITSEETNSNSKRNEREADFKHLEPPERESLRNSETILNRSQKSAGSTPRRRSSSSATNHEKRQSISPKNISTSKNKTRSESQEIRESSKKVSIDKNIDLEYLDIKPLDPFKKVDGKEANDVSMEFSSEVKPNKYINQSSHNKIASKASSDFKNSDNFDTKSRKIDSKKSYDRKEEISEGKRQSQTFHDYLRKSDDKKYHLEKKEESKSSIDIRRSREGIQSPKNTSKSFLNEDDNSRGFRLILNVQTPETINPNDISDNNYQTNRILRIKEEIDNESDSGQEPKLLRTPEEGLRSKTKLVLSDLAKTIEGEPYFQQGSQIESREKLLEPFDDSVKSSKRVNYGYSENPRVFFFKILTMPPPDPATKPRNNVLAEAITRSDAILHAKEIDEMIKQINRLIKNDCEFTYTVDKDIESLTPFNSETEKIKVLLRTRFSPPEDLFKRSSVTHLEHQLRLAKEAHNAFLKNNESKSPSNNYNNWN